MTGDTLLHADLNPANVLLSDDDTAYVVDWTLTGRGAALLEMALLTPWLLKGGHTRPKGNSGPHSSPPGRPPRSTTIDLFARFFVTK